MYVPPELKRQHEIWAKRLDAARRARIGGTGTAIFKGRSRADVDAKIAKAKRERRIGGAAIIDPLPSINPALVRPERGKSTVIGFPDDPANWLNVHPAHWPASFVPPSEATSFSVQRVSYFVFEPRWFQIAASLSDKWRSPSVYLLASTGGKR